jgi:hypothetical protein
MEFFQNQIIFERTLKSYVQDYVLVFFNKDRLWKITQTSDKYQGNRNRHAATLLKIQFGHNNHA